MERQNILNFMTNNKELLLVHASMYGVRPNHQVNVMLTPQFYTLKKEALPIKYAYQAKKIAPSLFDGLVDEGAEYEYIVFKEKINDEEKWVFIAYDIEKITTFLKSKGIELDYVNKIFFAQQALPLFLNGSLSLSEYDALTVIDNTVVVVPTVALGEDNIPLLRFTNAFTPNTGGVKIKSKSAERNSLLSRAQAFSLSSIFILFAGMFTVEGLRYEGDAKVEKEEIKSIYELYPYLGSSYTRQDAIDKFKTIDRAERRKRDAIKISSKIIFKGVTLKSLRVDEKSFSAQFTCSDKLISDRVKDLLKKEKNNFLTAEGETTLMIKGKL